MNERLGQILLDHGSITERQLVEGLELAEKHERKLGHQLLLNGIVGEEVLYRALAEQSGFKMGSPDKILDILDKDLIDKVPRPYLTHSQFLPVRKRGRNLLVVSADPNAPFEDLGQALEALHVEVQIVTPTTLRRIWSILDLAPGEMPRTVARDDDDLLDKSQESRLVAMFEAILLDAIDSRASDIHLEIYNGEPRLRYRIDGHMHDIPRFSLQQNDLRGVVQVIKISSEMDITERRLPQGGRIRRRAGDQVFDLRVQTQPALHGEHVVIRLLHQEQKVLSIEDLGFSGENADQYRRLLTSPQGLVLVVGPTGSGKSTTLYAGLQLLARDASRKVLTVEDPIEYALDGVQQSAVHPEIGFAFADAMRAFVREDPDVILVGEIRDAETALEAIRASQTGHLVLSTLHCNDSVDAVQRLFDLGMHPNSIASELIAVMSQRLVRRICDQCRQPAEPDEEILGELFPGHVPDTFQCFEGKGCAVCNGRGTKGRIAAVELLRVGANIRDGISNQMTVDQLRTLAYAGGLKPIRNNLIELVLQGVTPMSEIRRTLSIEQMAPKQEITD